MLFMVLAAAGAVLVPVAAYVAGGRLVGPYAGPRGLASYLGSIYADAFSGRPQALLLLLGPLLCMGIWELRGWLCRRYLAPAEAE
jgi:hypothetical protein